MILRRWRRDDDFAEMLYGDEIFEALDSQWDSKTSRVRGQIAASMSSRDMDDGVASEDRKARERPQSVQRRWRSAYCERVSRSRRIDHEGYPPSVEGDTRKASTRQT